MKKIEAESLNQAYADAAAHFECSVTELKIEIVQQPVKGFLGFFKKSAIIVAVRTAAVEKETVKPVENVEKKRELKKKKEVKKVVKKEQKEEYKEKTPKEETPSHTMLNDTIMPASFVSDQDEDDDLGSGLDYTADYDDEYDENESHEEEEVSNSNMESIAGEVDAQVNKLFNLTCFNIEKIEVSAYDSETLLVEFKGDDAALLIGKEGYRYKALSYMIFNWINSKYEVQLRLEIAEFLKNQEESIGRYLESVYQNIDRDGRAQTKILDGVLVQIALKELRERYADKYVVIRSTRDGLKYIIVNDYYNN